MRTEIPKICYALLSLNSGSSDIQFLRSFFQFYFYFVLRMKIYLIMLPLYLQIIMGNHCSKDKAQTLPYQDKQGP